MNFGGKVILGLSLGKQLKRGNMLAQGQGRDKAAIKPGAKI
jgi:hypothetical protein